MFKKIQLILFIFLGCIAGAAIFIAIWEFRPKALPHPSDSSMNESSAGETNEGIAAPKPRHMLDEVPLPAAYFNLTCKSHTDIEQSAVKQKIDADLGLKYAHQKIAGGIGLAFYSMELKMYQDGTFIEDTLMTHDKFVQQQGNEKTESTIDELPAEQQEAMTAAFATNLCEITLDANQNEMGRKILSQAGVVIMNEGNVNTARLMHGPYYSGKSNWQGVKRIPMTHGFVMDCPVEYAKLNGAGDEINVRGSFEKSELNSSQPDVVIKKVSCTLSGKETFDENIGEYTSGAMTLHYKFQVFQSGVQTATLDGDLNLSLERITANRK